VLRAHKVTQDQLAHKVFKEMKDQLVHREIWARLAHKANKDLLALKEKPGQQDPKEKLD
jgi:hypothetical protein